MEGVKNFANFLHTFYSILFIPYFLFSTFYSLLFTIVNNNPFAAFVWTIPANQTRSFHSLNVIKNTIRYSNTRIFFNSTNNCYFIFQATFQTTFLRTFQATFSVFYRSIWNFYRSI